MNEHFVPLALDTYFRGNSHEVEFCKAAGAGGNHLVAVTAAGRKLGDGGKHRGHVKLREAELAPLLAEFRALPEVERRPPLPDPADASPPQRAVPQPPDGGLIVRGYCTYMERADDGRARRAKRFYYEENPDAWAAETQSDMLWLTEAEWRALVPEELKVGARRTVAAPVQQRFFSTVGIDYMEGSVNALPVRESSMEVEVEELREDGGAVLTVTGSGAMGAPFSAEARSGPRTRGCELDVVGRIVVDSAGRIASFDLAGVGEAWGNKMDYTRREIRIPGARWHYGIACELVTGDRPYDRIPPYNLLHYGSGLKYFSAVD